VYNLVMEFHYKAARQNNIIEGDLEAANINEAVAKIAAMNAKPLVVKPVKSARKQIFLGFGSEMNLEDKVFVTRYLALMLRVGTDLFQAIDILIADFDKPAVKKFLIDVRSTLERGMPFYSAFAKYPKLFTPVFVNLIKAGEVSGNLEKVFDHLATYMEEQRELQHKIKSSLSYPIILAVASVLVMILIVSFSLPKVANVFMSGGMNPPGFSKVVFTIGLFVGDNLWIILSLIAIFAISGYLFFGKTLAGRKVLYAIGLKTPAIRKVIKHVALQRFTSTFSSLITSGVPIVESIEITSKSIGMPDLAEALMRTTLGEAFKKEPSFPKVVSNLIAVSEKSGHIESVLDSLSIFYASEIDTSVKSLVSFIEPVLLLFIGVIIGTIALAVIVPVYQLTTTF
jgi:type IV pilus assembly protein PilC